MTPQTPQFGKPARRRVRAFDLGPNVIEHQVGAKRIRDLIWVDPQDVQDVLATFSAQDVALPLYREHRPEDGSFGAVRLERAPDGGIDQVFDYSPEGRALVESGRYMFDSPEIVASAPDALGRKHLRDIRSGSLVNVPARTGSQPLLLSAKAKDHAMSLTTYQQFLEHAGQMEPLLKQLATAETEEGKAAAQVAEPLAKLIAQAQQQIQVLAPPPPSGDVVQMSGAARDAADLGARVLKMTGSASGAEAMGYLEAREGTVKALSAKVVEFGVAVGALPAAEADRFRAMEPAQLLGHIRGGAAVVNLSAKQAGDGAPPPAKVEAKPQADGVDTAYVENITAGLFGPKLGGK